MDVILCLLLDERSQQTQGWTRDVKARDQDETETLTFRDRDETETWVHRSRRDRDETFVGLVLET